MNRGGGRRKIFGPPPNGRKDRPDEDLLLFREMHKREKDRVVSLLQPVSDEFEANGNYPLYKMTSAKKGSSGYEFLAESSKNDYDWLKTPPATPLFPSLEMEANAPELVVQRELPIFQPLSRFSGYSATSKASSGSSKSPSPSPSPKPKVPPRSATPSEKALETKAPTGSKPVLSSQKTTQLSSNDHVSRRSNAASTVAKPTTHQKESPDEHFLGSNLSKSMGPIDSKTKPKSRGVSPLLRTTIPAQIPGFSDDKPPNLRTNRSSSAARGRSGNKTLANVSQKKESNSKTKRQSCSPSVTRGRKVETKQESTTETNVIPQKGKIQTGNGTQILGSRMVDKFMNARKSSAEERETKPKSRSPIHDSSGFGRLMSKSSLVMALKQMDIKREPVNFHRVGPTSRRS